MLERKVNVLHRRNLQRAIAVGITTNGVVKRDGRAVMGAGIARAATFVWPNIDLTLGLLLRTRGNHVNLLLTDMQSDIAPLSVFSFPTKENWQDPSPLKLIERSTQELVAWVNQNGWDRRAGIYLPRPGCSNGQRKWDTEVKPLLSKYLDNRFVVCHL